MLRAFDLGLVTALVMAVAYGVLWSVVELSWGLIAVGLIGGWAIGGAVKRGVISALLQRYPQEAAPEGGSVHRPWPRGTSTLAGLLGLLAWIVGTYVSFAIVALREGSGELLERLSPGNFAGYLNAIADQQLLQAAILAAFIVLAAYTARQPRLDLGERKRR